MTTMHELRRGRARCRAARALLIASIWAFYGVSANAQEADTSETREVDLLDVGVLEGTVENGVRVNRITGAKLRQGTTYLESDRATEFIDAREYLFVGNVLIIDEGDTLSARQVYYDSDAKLGRATGDVRLSDGEIEVFAPSGRYFVDEKRAEFDEGVRLVDSTAIVTSATGEYWSEEKRGSFAGDVELREGPTYLSSDSLTVLREQRQSFARGDVFIQRFGSDETPQGAAVDSSVVTYLLGEDAFSDEIAEISRVRGQPVVMQVRTDSTGESVDTTVVRAREITISRDDSLDRLVAVDSVRIWQTAFAAVGDSITYDRILLADSSYSETLYLLEAPMSWIQTSQVFGDTISVVTGPSSLDTLYVWGDAFVAQQDTTLARINQLAGRALTGLIEDDSLRTLEVRPNARAIRYLADEDGSLSWAVRLSGDSVVIQFTGEDRAEVTFGRDTEGKGYPPDLIPTPFDLEGFRWEPDRRPTLEGLIDLKRIHERVSRAGRADSVAPVSAAL